MRMDFERGQRNAPKGHAILYFRDASAQDDVYAAYLVVPPVVINIAKYMPPMFATRVSMAELQAVSAVPLPPVPEKLDGLGEAQALAEMRDDDLIYGGTINPTDVERLLTLTAEAAQQYHSLYQDYASRYQPETPSGSSVAELLDSFMTERERISELAKLTGKLRYAMEGRDKSLIDETVKEMGHIAKPLPEKYRVKELIAAALVPTPKGSALSDLYLQRCYKLFEEDYRGLESLELKIKELQAAP